MLMRMLMTRADAGDSSAGAVMAAVVSVAVAVGTSGWFGIGVQLLLLLVVVVVVLLQPLRWSHYHHHHPPLSWTPIWLAMRRYSGPGLVTLQRKPLCGHLPIDDASRFAARNAQWAAQKAIDSVFPWQRRTDIAVEVDQ